MSAAVLSDLLSEAAARAPDAPAVIDGDRSLTYGELEAAANRIAGLLRRSGVRPGHRVGLHLEKSIEAVAGIYGVLRSGAAYVPVDPGAPRLRCAGILADAEVSCLIVDRARLAGWSDEDGPPLPAKRAILLDVPLGSPSGAGAGGAAPKGEPDGVPAGAGLAGCEVSVLGSGELASIPAEEAGRAATATDVAYVLYTSGSTGVPKGVVLSHENALAFVRWTVRHYGLAGDDVLTSHAPFHFDLSVFDLYAAASVAAPVVLVGRTASMFPRELCRLAERHHVTTWYSVPSLLTMLSLRGGLNTGSMPELRRVLFAGEVFPTRYLRTLMEQLPHVSFHNLYGPTETNVCAYYDVGREAALGDEPIPIGRAIDGVDLAVVDDDGSIVADGEVGELLVAGPTVMQGYWRDEERTARSLVIRGREGSRRPWYRTGDLVRLRPDGDLDFLGRRDTQTKSRGYRIELGDVEAALYTHPSVTEVAVLAVPDALVGNRLRAIAVAPGLTALDLATHCKDRLPSYMVPDEFVFVEELPKTSTGKIDRRAAGELGVPDTEAEKGAKA